jgi:poly(3-hydroxybutyrate) depolymerase
MTLLHLIPPRLTLLHGTLRRLPLLRPTLRRLALPLLAMLVLAPLTGAALAQPVSLPAMKTGQLSVSGLSSGGYMAVQFDVAYSSLVVGVGVVAAGPYSCSRGNLSTAIFTCSCTSTLPWCGVTNGGTNVPGLVKVTDDYAARGTIDATSNMAKQRVWLFSGTADSIVPTVVMNDLQVYYKKYVPPANISYRTDVGAEHAFPTDSFGNRCDFLGSPYLNNCGIDGAGALLQWIYGDLVPKTGNGGAGRLIEFGQAEFLASPTEHGMAQTGWAYIPPGCEGQGNGCRLHVSFHGCKQTSALVGDAYVRNAGFNGWADANRIVVLYPQAAPVAMKNPNACWDWWNYDDPDFAVKSGRQMLAVKRMTERLMDAAAPLAPVK